jgi:ATP-binding cassette, subfamily B, bacterial PglK
MYKNLKKIINIITKKYFVQIFYLQTIILVQSIFQILSILSIGPLLILVTKSKQSFEKFFYIDFLNIDLSFKNLLFITIFLFIGSNVLNVIVIRKSLLLCNMIGKNISNNLFFLYLNKDYPFFFDKKLSYFITLMTTEVQRVVHAIILPLLILNSKLLTLIFILIGVSIYSPISSIIGISFSLIGSLIFYSIIKKKLYHHGKNISRQSILRNGLIVDTFGNIKQTKLFSAQNFFYQKFCSINEDIAKSLVLTRFIETLIKNIIEILIFVLILVSIYFLYILDQSIVDYLSLFAVLLYAAYKVVPTIQNIVSMFATIKTNIPVLENITKEFGYKIFNPSKRLNNLEKINKSINKISLEDVSFSYKDSKNLVLNKTNVVFKKGELTGIYGPSGSGKTTVADLICGLIKPLNGKILVNDKQFKLDSNTELKNLFSYISQNFTLINGTFISNIIFANSYDKKKFDETLKLSLSSNIGQLKSSRTLGDFGSKLSGGQKQRIAIARTLYNNSQVIILDEPTSALDTITEIEIIQNLKKISKNKIMIIFTHNQNLKKFFDRKYVIKNKKIIKLN